MTEHMEAWLIPCDTPNTCGYTFSPDNVSRTLFGFWEAYRPPAGVVACRQTRSRDGDEREACDSDA